MKPHGPGEGEGGVMEMEGFLHPSEEGSSVGPHQRRPLKLELRADGPWVWCHPAMPVARSSGELGLAKAV